MNYSKAIRIARTLAGLSQRELATKVRLDPSLVSMLETGKRKPSLSTVERIADELGIPSYLFTLLASEEADLRNTSPETMHQLSSGLMRLLLKETEDDPRTEIAAQADPTARHQKSQPTVVRARRKARKVG
jgi:transcriptional regulator with XRE-family HTH domain